MTFRTPPPPWTYSPRAPWNRYFFRLRFLSHERPQEAPKRPARNPTWTKRDLKLKPKSSLFRRHTIFRKRDSLCSRFRFLRKWTIKTRDASVCNNSFHAKSSLIRWFLAFCHVHHTFLSHFGPHLGTPPPSSKLSLFTLCAHVRSIPVTLHTQGEEMPEKVSETMPAS